MSHSEESLAQYVKRVMKEKRLSLNDVELMSGRRITDAYVGSIITGRAKNLTVEKLQALARGLGVDEEDVFCVARGMSVPRERERREVDPWHSMLVLSLMERVLLNPDVLEILQAVVDLSREERADVLKFIDTLSDRGRKSGRGRRSA
jgi:transcriptional regulator with XRE-family HTH domain